MDNTVNYWKFPLKECGAMIHFAVFLNEWKVLYMVWLSLMWELTWWRHSSGVAFDRSRFVISLDPFRSRNIKDLKTVHWFKFQRQKGKKTPLFCSDYIIFLYNCVVLDDRWVNWETTVFIRGVERWNTQLSRVLEWKFHVSACTCVQLWPSLTNTQIVMNTLNGYYSLRCIPYM